MNVTLVCESSFEGIMTAVYDGWVLMNKGYQVNIYPRNNYNPSFFSEYQLIETNIEKADKVSKSIRIKISIKAYMMVYRASMHYDENRANAIFAFLKLAYPVGAGVTNMLNKPEVMKILELSRKVANETHLFKGFVRFDELRGGVLFSTIEPKCDIILLLSHHFEERFPLEKFILYDKTRKKAVIHGEGNPSIQIIDNDIERKVRSMIKEDEYEELWHVFFEHIAIDARNNPQCQNTLIPQWYRKNMTEFGKNH